jgi:serine/threonine-protein kinase
MSPEQARSGRVGPLADVWALGAMLYEALTGAAPFDRAGRQGWEVMQAVVDEEPALPRRRDRSIPVELEAICLKALEKEPARRYASMAEAAADLGRWLRGEPVAARAASPWTRIWRGRRTGDGR